MRHVEFRSRRLGVNDAGNSIRQFVADGMWNENCDGRTSRANPTRLVRSLSQVNQNLHERRGWQATTVRHGGPDIGEDGIEVDAPAGN